VEGSNWLNEFDKSSVGDGVVTRRRVEELIFEASYKFMVNKHVSARSKSFELIQALNADPVHHRYLVMCKLCASLWQINKSVEVDYYKIRCNGKHRILIPANYARRTSDYLHETTQQYTFGERDGLVMYGELPLFDVREQQPEIHLYTLRFDSGSHVHSMVKYIEVSNVLRALPHLLVRRSSLLATPRRSLLKTGTHSSSPSGVLLERKEEEESGDLGAFGPMDQYLVFVADNALLVDVPAGRHGGRRLGDDPQQQGGGGGGPPVPGKAFAFVPCFKYAASKDVILFTVKNFKFHVDSGGQFNENYYGMKHELIECICSDQLYVDLNDDHVFKQFYFHEVLGESKTVLFFPDYRLQVTSQRQLISLLDLAIHARNIGFFVLVLLNLRRVSVQLRYELKRISGPWKAAIMYAHLQEENDEYDVQDLCAAVL